MSQCCCSCCSEGLGWQCTQSSTCSTSPGSRKRFISTASPLYHHVLKHGRFRQGFRLPVRPAASDPPPRRHVPRDSLSGEHPLPLPSRTSLPRLAGIFLPFRGVLTGIARGDRRLGTADLATPASEARATTSCIMPSSSATMVKFHCIFTACHTCLEAAVEPSRAPGHSRSAHSIPARNGAWTRGP